MADNYLQFSQTLDALTPEEEQWLKEQLAADPEAECPIFLLDYPDRDPDDSDCGFYISFEGQGDTRHLWIYDGNYGHVEHVGHLVQKFLKRFRPDQCWSLTYACTCSKPRVGEFSGGAIFVTADEIRGVSGDEFIYEQRREFETAKAAAEAVA